MPVYYTIFCGKRQEVFLMRGRRPLRTPFFSLPPRRGFAGAGAPAPPDAGAPPCTRGRFMQGHSPCTPPAGRGAAPPGASRQTWLLAPPCTRGSFLRDGSPSTHLLGAPPQTPGDFRFTTKVTKGVSGGAPLNPRGGHYHPPSGVAAPPRRTLPLGVGGGVGLCFPPRRIGVSGCRYPFLYSGKKLLDARWGAQAVHGR